MSRIFRSEDTAIRRLTLYSWSSSGRLLASGSDDTYLNIWEYNPTELAKPFTLNTSVSTGHRANIFSVKFMPHSNDRTVVTCAGDSEVRVFDLECSGGNQATSGVSENTRSRRLDNFFTGCKWYNEANTNAKAYRSHADRAKRIVTESSPFLFLSCSEDGEVRQWDLRLPSSAYPPPREARSGYRRYMNTGENGDAAPALISYKSYGLDLNTISCSKSQPHYIALGGAHLHCFLHDRRMLGRNIDAEKGRPVSSPPEAGSPDDNVMREATKCVRRFAPNNKHKMKPGDHNHITACKISDARPNEVIASWSGDHVYSFDIVKGPDARDKDKNANVEYRKVQLANRAERKRKRSQLASSTSNSNSAARGVKLKTSARTGNETLRVRYENGEQIEAAEGESIDNLAIAHQNLLSEAQKQSERIAKALVKLRKTLFDFQTTLEDVQEPLEPASQSNDLTRNTPTYTSILAQAVEILPEMEDVMRNWTYPNTTEEDEIMLQNTLRRNRQSSWRFIQAAGTLAYNLGGKLQTTSDGIDPRLQQFQRIRLAAMEGRKIDKEQRFCYDFVKAILLWLGGGREALIAGFKRPPETSGDTERYPFDALADLNTVSDMLRGYLMSLASEEKPIVDLGTNQFERDELRRLFPDQTSAVNAFIRAVEVMELRDHHGTSEIIQESSGGVKKRIMDRGAAFRYWGEKVCRALLMDAAEGVTFNYVNRAFGGLNVHVLPDDEAIDRILDEVIEMEEDPDLNIPGSFDANTVETTDTPGSQPSTIPTVMVEDAYDDEEESNDDDNVAEDDESEDDDDSEAEETDPLQAIYSRRRGLYRGGALSAQRAMVNSDVAYSSHTKVYKGHCNARTVKDVNYYGLDDEYVVSGSDDGHFFIWDAKTMEIVNILEGDGEVVNVIQGHPYEPMIACSGIDSTIKIFGPSGNSRERYDARRGINIANPGGGRHSSLGMARRRGTVRTTEDEDMKDDLADREDPDLDPDATRAILAEKIARGGLKSRQVPPDKWYEIMSQNNAESQQGRGEAFLTVSDLDEFLVQAWVMSNAMVT